MRKSVIVGIIILVVIVVVVALGLNSINIIKGTQTTSSDDGWRSDGIILMQNVETGEYGCFGCNDVLCVDPAPVMEERIESEDIYCTSKFEVVR